MQPRGTTPLYYAIYRPARRPYTECAAAQIISVKDMDKTVCRAILLYGDFYVRLA